MLNFFTEVIITIVYWSGSSFMILVSVVNDEMILTTLLMMELMVPTEIQ